MDRIFVQLIIIGYTTTSPFLFLWFHKKVLNEKWDNDLTDYLTIIIYLTSNIIAAVIGYMIQECGRCL